MNKKNTQYLVETYAPLYEYCRAFECRDGWFDIINNLSAEIHYIILKSGSSCRASQVKEKYGTLRYYMDTETDEISYLIKKAEQLSETICELCGDPAKLRGTVSVSTVCEKCVE